MKRRLAIFAICVVILLLARAHTRASGPYYISFSSGNNTNNGTSESTPWKSSPGMGASSSCGGAIHSYSHVAGDHFVFKGGDTWPAACLPLNISWSGTSSAIDYWGVDRTWHTGGSFTDPIFDAAHATKNNMINASGRTYLTIDGLDLAHQGITPTTSFSTASCGIYFGNLSWGAWLPGTTVENLKIYDWAVTSNLNQTPTNNFDNICVGGILSAAVVNNVETSGLNSYAYISGSQVFNPFGGGVTGVGELRNSKIHDGWNGCTTSGSCHDNEFYHISGGAVENYTGVHSQVIEDNEPCPTSPGHSMAVYNNLVHDNTNVGVVFYLRYFSQVYNNVFWNNSQNAIQYCVPNSDSSSNVGYAFNNTFDVGGRTAMVARTGAPKALGTFYNQNNIVINGTLGNLSATSGTASNNYSMSSTEAATYGFTSGHLYAPTSSNSNVTGKGINLTSRCFGGLLALCKDTEGAPWYGGDYQPRATGSVAWTLGAYIWPPGGGGGGGPTAPTVTITSPSGTVSGTQIFIVNCSPTDGGSVVSVQQSIDGTAFGSTGTVSPFPQSWNTAAYSNASHALGSTCTDSKGGVGIAPTVNVTVNNSTPGCVTSDATFTQSVTFTAQTGAFVVAFTFTPNAIPQDTVFGTSNGAATAYTELAEIVRIDPATGVLEVRNGANYQNTSVTPVGSTAYTIQLVGNVATHTYAAYETSPASVTLGTNLAFRTEQASVTSLNRVTAVSANAAPQTSSMCNVSLPAPTFTPGVLDLGNVATGAANTASIVGTGATTYSSVSIAGDASFTIYSNTCMASVVSNCTAVVKFLPTTPGPKSATLTFNYSSSGSPAVIKVSGVGLSTPVFANIGLSQ